MKPISMDKRELIIAAKARGEKVEDIALWVGVATSTVYKIIAMQKKYGTIESKPFPGRQSRLTPEQLAKIKETVENNKDITLDELIEKLELPIKKSRLSAVLIGMNFSFKKRQFIQKHKNEKRSSKTVLNGRKNKAN